MFGRSKDIESSDKSEIKELIDKEGLSDEVRNLFELMKFRLHFDKKESQVKQRIIRIFIDEATHRDNMRFTSLQISQLGGEVVTRQAPVHYGLLLRKYKIKSTDSAKDIAKKLIAATRETKVISQIERAALLSTIKIKLSQDEIEKMMKEGHQQFMEWLEKKMQEMASSPTMTIESINADIACYEKSVDKVLSEFVEKTTDEIKETFGEIFDEFKTEGESNDNVADKIKETIKADLAKEPKDRECIKSFDHVVETVTKSMEEVAKPVTNRRIAERVVDQMGSGGFESEAQRKAFTKDLEIVLNENQELTKQEEAEPSRLKKIESSVQKLLESRKGFSTRVRNYIENGMTGSDLADYMESVSKKDSEGEAFEAFNKIYAEKLDNYLKNTNYAMGDKTGTTQIKAEDLTDDAIREIRIRAANQYLAEHRHGFDKSKFLLEQSASFMLLIKCAINRMVKNFISSIKRSKNEVEAQAGMGEVFMKNSEDPTIRATMFARHQLNTPMDLVSNALNKIKPDARIANQGFKSLTAVKKFSKSFNQKFQATRPKGSVDLRSNWKSIQNAIKATTAAKAQIEKIEQTPQSPAQRT